MPRLFLLTDMPIFSQRAHVSRIHSWRIPSAYLEGLCIRADLCQLTYCWDVPSTSFQNVSAKYLWNIASLFCNCALDSFRYLFLLDCARNIPALQNWHICNWVTVTQMVLSAFFYYNTIELRGLRFPVLDMRPLCVADTYERRWVSNAFFYYNTFVLALTFVAEVRTLRLNVISVCVECMYANDVRKRKIWLMW